MGQAFDSRGNVLGEAFGNTKQEVFEKLNGAFKDAHEIRVRSLADRVAAARDSSPTAEMPRYRCHKEVHALKIKQVVKHAHPDPLFNDAMFEASAEFQGAHLFFEEPGYGPVPVEAEWYRKHNPNAGGYYVVYNDGYRSFSPAHAFEEGYTRL